MDLNAASLLLGKAIAGETSSLSRYGIVLEKGATQTEIMAALTRQFGGAAEASADPMTQMKNRLGDLVQVLGDMLLPVMEKITVLVEKLTRRIIAWADSHPTLTKIVGLTAVAIGALALVVGPLLLLLPTMAASIGILSVAFGALSLSMLPVTLTIMGIAAAITAGILIWQNWDTIILGLKKTLEVLKATFKTVFDFIKEIVSKVFAKITDVFNSKLMWLLPHGALIKAIIFLAQNWKEIWTGIQTTFKTVTDALVGTFRSVKGTILGIWDGMVSGIKSGVNTVIKVINGFINGINKLEIKFPSWKSWTIGIGKASVTFPGFGGKTIGFPKIDPIPELAQGGIVNRPTLAMIGEKGPEAVIPLGRGRGGAGMTINLVINGDILGMDDFEQKVTSVIRDAVLGGGFSGVLARA
jgi:phage-related protein